MRSDMRNGAMVMVSLLALACQPEPTVVLNESEVLSTTTGQGAAPMYAISPGGARTVAWIAAPGAGSDGRLYTRTGGGTPSELQDPLGSIEPHGEAPPKLVYAGDGTLYALYAVVKVVPGRRFPHATLRLASSRDDGESWDAPRSVSPDSLNGSRNFHALHVAPDGSIYVAWLESRGALPSATYITRSVDGGFSWTPATRVAEDESCPCCRTAIATASDGRVYLAWRSVLPGNVRDIVVAMSSDNGATWSEPVRVHEDNWVFEGCPHAGPSMQVDSAGAVHIAWWTGKDGAPGVYYARTESAGLGFGDAVPLGTADFSRPAHVQLALGESGRIVAVWDDGSEEPSRVLVRVSSNGGRSFGAPVLASDTALAAGYPVLAMRGDSLTLAWSQQATVPAGPSEPAGHEGHGAATVPDSVMQMEGGLPVVGAQEVVVRAGRLR